MAQRSTHKCYTIQGLSIDSQAYSSITLLLITANKLSTNKDGGIFTGCWRGPIYTPLKLYKLKTYSILITFKEKLTTVRLHKRSKGERNVLFNDALNTFYLRLYGIRHMVKDHSDSEKGNPLPPHRLLLSINSKGSLICTIPQTG